MGAFLILVWQDHATQQDPQAENRSSCNGSRKLIRESRCLRELGAFLRKRGADEYVIELLGVAVVQVAVPLDLFDPGHGIDILEPSDGREVDHRLDDAELVEVARRDDVCVGFVGENLGDESLYTLV